MCDEHPDRPAIANVQSETDSFGYETHLVCVECLAEDRAYAASDEARTGRCDWCKIDATDLVWARSYDEGLDGPTYRVCGACKERQNRRLQEELEAYDDADWDEPDDPHDDDWAYCGLLSDGSCTLAGTEQCGFDCPHSGLSQGMEAGTAETEGLGAKPDSPVTVGHAPDQSPQPTAKAKSTEQESAA